MKMEGFIILGPVIRLLRRALTWRAGWTLVERGRLVWPPRRDV